MKQTLFTFVAILIFQQLAFSAVAVKGMTYSYMNSIHSENLRRWYNEKLGVNISNNPEVEGWGESRFPTGSQFGIQNVKDQVGSHKAGPMIVFEVTNIEAAVSDLQRSGVRFEQPQGKLSPIFIHGPVKVATFIDLDGNYAQLMQLPAQKK